MTRLNKIISATNNSQALLHSLLIVSPILLLPIGRLAELPIAVMAILGMVYTFNNPRKQFFHWPIKYFSLLFLLVWLPIALSYPDSYNPERTLKVVTGHIRFYLAGLYIITLYRNPEISKTVSKWLFWVVLILIFDAFFQFMVGIDLFGYKYEGSRLNGLFGDDLKLGLILALLSPFLFFHSLSQPWPIRTIIWSSFLLILLLSGSRASWIITAVVTIGLVIYQIKCKKIYIRQLLITLLLLLVSSVIIYTQSASVQNRVNTSLLIFKGDRASIDQAISHRLPLWSIALRMINANPINGIGGRTFRDAYQDFAPEDDLFLSADVTPTHVHQIILEVTAETGAIGLIGLVIFYVLFIINTYRYGLKSDISAVFSLCVLGVIFPLNTHLALYSSFWGMLFWWSLAQHAALLNTPPRINSE